MITALSACGSDDTENGDTANDDTASGDEASADPGVTRASGGGMVIIDDVAYTSDTEVGSASSRSRAS